MRQQAEQRTSQDEAVNRHLESQFESQEKERAEWDRLRSGGTAGFEALSEQWLAASKQLVDDVDAVNEWFIETFTEKYDDVESIYEDEERRRECAAASCHSGGYAVIVSKVTDPREAVDPEHSEFDYRDWIDCIVIPYLEGRLGYTDEGAERVVKRAQHVSPETVLNEVALDDAVRIKGELVRIGCKAQVVEGRPQSMRGGGVRPPISESVRHEVWRRDQGHYVDCGSKERLEFDHIIPVSRGGSNTVRNIELRCEPCNRKKGASI
jgi:5-methylcytosine-specific restriction endonuclease McrA